MECRNPDRRDAGVPMPEKQPCVYLLASDRNGTLYLGVTSNLVRRTHEHRSAVEGFSKQYRVHHLVWYEQHTDMSGAILREKQIKKWTRAAKIRLIEANNPSWNDLWSEML
jgi:putative endonuclease